jgi:hypothetical protein
MFHPHFLSIFQGHLSLGSKCQTRDQLGTNFNFKFKVDLSGTLIGLWDYRYMKVVWV